jgi:hypothetical protein
MHRQTDDTAAAGVGLIEEFRMRKRDTVSLIAQRPRPTVQRFNSRAVSLVTCLIEEGGREGR